MYEEWSRTVVHLEGATNSLHWSERRTALNELRRRHDIGEISHEDYGIQYDRYTALDLRYTGTATLLKSEDRHYLLTARHVLHDKFTGEMDLQAARQRPGYNPSDDDLYEMIAEMQIFPLIFQVSSIDDAINGSPADGTLLALQSGYPPALPYTFSDPLLDLAIVSLRDQASDFLNKLLRSGYKAVDVSSISKRRVSVGEDIFTVGFPASTSHIDELQPDMAQHITPDRRSMLVSTPVFSFGKVAMAHEALEYFWADMSVYPGNSGGPVIRDNEIVGVVSAQATVPVNDTSGERVGIPFGMIVHSDAIMSLIKEQEKKDRFARGDRPDWR